jgi:uncharacterized membrane protein YvbJ
MAQIICPKCGKEISSRDEKCPYCGMPMIEIKKVLKERRKEAKAQHVSSCLGDVQYKTTAILGAPPQLYDKYENSGRSYLWSRWIFGIIAIVAFGCIFWTIYEHIGLPF